MSDSSLAGLLPGSDVGFVARVDGAVIDEGGPVGSGQIRVILSTRPFRHGDAMTLRGGVFQAVGPSRPLADNPRRHATTVVHIA